MPSAAEAEQDKVEGGGDYPDGECGIFRQNIWQNISASSEVDEEIEDLLMLDLTHEEIKAAFRFNIKSCKMSVCVFEFLLHLLVTHC